MIFPSRIDTKRPYLLILMRLIDTLMITLREQHYNYGTNGT
jgi:hypothetical protein